MFYFVTFVLAFCSILYELLMAQSLSAFLGDTVLRYSTTVGLYLASLGIGAFLCRGKVLNRPLYALVKVELFLSLVGGFCVVYLHLFNIFVPSVNLFFIFSHTLIVSIGILSGFEIPLLLQIKRREKDVTINPVLGVNYFGALSGSVAFPILSLPRLGILSSAFLTGFLNGVGGLLLIFVINRKPMRIFWHCVVINVLLLAVLVLCLSFSTRIEAYFIARYISP